MKKVNGLALQHHRSLRRHCRRVGFRVRQSSEIKLVRDLFGSVGIKAAVEVKVIGCRKCGNLVSCVCVINQQHKADCCFRLAANLPFELACDHGFQACPLCDPCDCGVSET